MSSSAKSIRIFIGTYSLRGGQGIYAADYDPATGGWSDPLPVGVLPNATFQVLAPDGRHLYSVCEDREQGVRTNGSICALSIEPESGRVALMERRSSLGDGPCHLALAPRGGHVVVSHYASGSVAVFPLRPDGTLGEPSAYVQHHGGSGVVADRQEGPHAHSTAFSPDGRILYAADLGQDRLRISRFDPADGSLKPGDPTEVMSAPGSGPRHLAWHPGGRLLAVVHELDNTVALYAPEGESGGLRRLQMVSTLPSGWVGTSYAAEVQFSPDGRFLYASNRGHDSVARFTVDAERGALDSRGCASVNGRWPRHFRLTPDGAILFSANQESDTVTVFRVDPATGDLLRAGDALRVPAPVCLTPAVGAVGAAGGNGHG